MPNRRDMKLLVCVLNETQRLNDLLAAMTELGISGATVLESQGMAGVLAKEAPVIAGLRHLVTQGRTFNYTIISVVEDDQVADRTLKAIEDHLLPGTKAGTRGVAFTVPVDKFVRFHPHGQEVLSPGEPPSKPEEVCGSSFERAMLAALKRNDAAPPKLVSKLVDGLRSLVEPGPTTELRERRRAPRVGCEYTVTAEGENKTVSGTLCDIGLFGVGFLCGENLPVGTVWALSPPAPVAEDSPALVKCRVEQSNKEGDLFRIGFAYQEEAEVLSKSWIAHLLRELGYSLGHLIQRRKQRRVPTRIPAEFQTRDGETSVPAALLDLGLEGALIRSEVDWFQGTEVGLLIGPYGDHESFYLEGITVDLRPDPHEEGWLHGVRFYPPDSGRLRRLWELVLDQLKHPVSTGSE